MLRNVTEQIFCRYFNDIKSRNPRDTEYNDIGKQKVTYRHRFNEKQFFCRDQGLGDRMHPHARCCVSKI